MASRFWFEKRSTFVEKHGVLVRLSFRLSYAKGNKVNWLFFNLVSNPNTGRFQGFKTL